MSINDFLRRSARAMVPRGPVPPPVFANPDILAKAGAETFVERYREIVSDPLNLVIARVPQAGYVDGTGHVILHNGNRADLTGPYAYYAEFSDILIINRGVHEPLEEFCFQQLLARMAGPAPVMLELGAYWAHYSMWMKRKFPQARCIMVEPEAHNAECGRHNFALNGYEGEFIVDFVGREHFGVDRFMAESGIARLDLLHSDIQGWEMEMIEGATATLAGHRADYVFVSTHSDPLHAAVCDALAGHGYRIEVSSPFEGHTTSHDGFIMASAPGVAPVFGELKTLGRAEIAHASVGELVAEVNRLAGVAGG